MYYINTYYIYWIFCLKRGICLDVRNSFHKLTMSATLTSVTEQVSTNIILCKMKIKYLSYFFVPVCKYAITEV